MPEVRELETCSSIIEIGNFNEDSYYPSSWNKRSKPTKKDLFQLIARDFIENYFYDDYHSPEFPSSFLAVTRNDHQKLWAKVLKEAGFRGKLIASRHAKNPEKEKILTLWTRYTIPKEVKALIKEHQKESKNDNW